MNKEVKNIELKFFILTIILLISTFLTSWIENTYVLNFLIFFRISIAVLECYFGCIMLMKFTGSNKDSDENDDNLEK